MANYSKRDEWKARVAEMATASGGRLSDKPLPSCWCGEPAVLEVSMRDGTRYFCQTHAAEGESLFANRLA